MNLCGWTVSPCDNEFPTYSTPSKANYPIYPKVQSVNNSRIVGKKSIRAINAEYNNKQNFEYQYASPPLPPSKKQNNQYTNATNITTQNFNKNSPNRNNIFVNDQQSKKDKVRQSSNSLNSHLKRSNNSISPNPTYTIAQQLMTTKQNNQTTNISVNLTHSNVQKSYSELLKQNQKLKKIIEQEYKPLVVMYEKLKEQNFQRDYQVSQLQWKVKQLAKEVSAKKK